jgi:hypothetical protein
MGKPESLTKKEKKPKPPVSTAALSELPCSPSVLRFLRIGWLSEFLSLLGQGCKFYGVLTAEVVVLAFVVCGGIFFELLKLVPAFWDFVVRVLAKVGVVGKGD